MDETEDQALTEQADAEGAAASGGQGQESESGFFNRILRGAAGLFRDEDDSPAAKETDQPEDKPTEPVEPPAPVTYSQVEFDEAVKRQAQSLKDRELRDERRTDAVKRADAGDFAGLVELADRGDNTYAERELTKRGATYELAQAAAKRVEAEQSAETRQAATAEHAAAITPYFDEAVLNPLLLAAPEDARQRIIAKGIVGLEGRTDATKAAIDAIRTQAATEAATKALSDEKFARALMATEGFRKALIADPVANKSLRAYFRGEIEEPDAHPGVGGPTRELGGTENQVMNRTLRDAISSALGRRDRDGAAPDDE